MIKKRVYFYKKMPKRLIAWAFSLLAVGVSSFAVYAAIQSNSGSVTEADGYQWPSASPVTNVNTHKLTTGELNENKTIINSSEVKIPELSDSIYGVVYDDAIVYRKDFNGSVKQTITGKGLTFSDKNKKADNGYVMVDLNEANKWIQVFNGNPAYVFSGSVVNTYTIKEASKGIEYQAYNLADIAEACGGAGGNFGFNEIGGKWVNYTEYNITPRPNEVKVKADKATYKVGETAQIMATGTDHSIYNKGIVSVNLAVVYKPTNAIIKQQSGVTSFSVVPDKPGLYEVTYIMTDSHDRTPLGSTDMVKSLPAKTTFTVEEGTGGGTDPGGGSGSGNENLAITNIDFEPSSGLTSWSQLKYVYATFKNEGKKTWSPAVAFAMRTDPDDPNTAFGTVVPDSSSSTLIRWDPIKSRYFFPNFQPGETRFIKFKFTAPAGTLAAGSAPRIQSVMQGMKQAVSQSIFQLDESGQQEKIKNLIVLIPSNDNAVQQGKVSMDISPSIEKNISPVSFETQQVGINQYNLVFKVRNDEKETLNTAITILLYGQKPTVHPLKDFKPGEVRTIVHPVNLEPILKK